MKLFTHLLDKTPLTFGKYEGSTPEEIADLDPSYIVWMYENISPKKCTRELYLACEEEEHYDYDAFPDDSGHRF